ncbi:hypothetical protein HAX54_034711 [Datura stramonium]|uniref:LOB domain-containing protein n=1 Tax=Datura stramonium TaxID=4076 RepID=A0ABS8SEK0_DATST|nr:hypothetical protein [Datura stramonium]
MELLEGEKRYEIIEVVDTKKAGEQKRGSRVEGFFKSFEVLCFRVLHCAIESFVFSVDWKLLVGYWSLKELAFDESMAIKASNWHWKFGIRLLVSSRVSYSSKKYLSSRAALIYGASNVGKMLQQVEEHQRGDVADSLYYEAYCRIKNPVYGCVGIISILHQEIDHLECELAKLQAEISLVKAQGKTEAQLAQGQQVELSSLPSSVDLSTTPWFY